MNVPKTSRIVLVTLSLGFAVGCASPETVRKYQDELRDLREELTQVKKENRELRREQDDFETRLAEASMVDASAALGTTSYPDLEGLGGVEVYSRDGNLVISIESSVTFPSGRAELTKQGKETLESISRVLRNEHPNSEYWIEGHTDSDPIRKSKWKSNRELSVVRAMAVHAYLVNHCSIEDEQCVVAGHGQYEPVAENTDKGGKAKNRRVEIVVHRPRP